MIARQYKNVQSICNTLAINMIVVDGVLSLHMSENMPGW